MTGRNPTKFAAAFEAALAQHGMKKADAAERLSVSRAYVSKITTGGAAVLPGRIETMADALGFTSAERQRLHRAAALDAGFRLDLPDDF